MARVADSAGPPSPVWVPAPAAGASDRLVVFAAAQPGDALYVGYPPSPWVAVRRIAAAESPPIHKGNGLAGCG